MPPLYFPKLIQINYDLMLRRKWLWFVPNLMQILSIFLKWHAIKQSGLTFLAYRVSIINSDKLSHSYDDLYLGVTFLGQKVCGLLACAIARYVVYVCQSELQHLAMLCQPRDILYDVSSTGTQWRGKDRLTESDADNECKVSLTLSLSLTGLTLKYYSTQQKGSNFKTYLRPFTTVGFKLHKNMHFKTYYFNNEACNSRVDTPWGKTVLIN